MHRFQVTPELARAEVVALPEEEARHAATVLRLRAGDPVELLDGAGGRIEATVESAGKRDVSVRVARRHQMPPRRPELWLLAALTKGKAWDNTVQKATELGAAVIVPVACDHCVVRIAPAEAASKLEAWHRTAVEAAKQCGTPWLPRLHAPVSVAEAVRLTAPVEARFVAALSGDTRTIRGWAGDVRTRLGRGPSGVAVMIGPEGDFTPGELGALLGAGFLPVTLGPLVLRADTAAIASLAVLQSEFGADA